MWLHPTQGELCSKEDNIAKLETRSAVLRPPVFGLGLFFASDCDDFGLDLKRSRDLAFSAVPEGQSFSFMCPNKCQDPSKSKKVALVISSRLSHRAQPLVVGYVCTLYAWQSVQGRMKQSVGASCLLMGIFSPGSFVQEVICASTVGEYEMRTL